MKVNYVDYISIAVKDLDEAVEDHKNAFGWEVAGRYADLDEKIRVCYWWVDERPRFVKELNRHFAFIHPKVGHGILTEVIDGEY